ncbi:hypothetical protein EV356DRAFT_207583 [Viridothelium virens]|uniref:Uncharacterized protein n=1 Tax=Viridothelium virens TaxID=1048519 RepID=A0A6A6H5T7_VIRVR|nr:hypothetical protein EV356DRAFT_207583 [Viridothelium virens]
MSFTNRPVYTRMVEAAYSFLVAALGFVSFLAGPASAGQTSNQLTFGKVNVGTLVAAIPFGTLISLSLALGISSILEPYSRYARDLRTWIDHWLDPCVDYCSWIFTYVIRNIQTYTAYWLACGLWAARYIVWYMRQLLRR